MRSIFLFLDDYRNPRDVTWDRDFAKIPSFICWKIVRNIDEFREFVSNNLENIAHIAFDHDLAPEHYGRDLSDDGQTGLDCAKYLVELCMDRNVELPAFSSHSMNACGRDNILGLLRNFARFQAEN